MAKTLNIAVEGCCHGELDRIYQTIQDSENINGIHVDLLLICGDFECLRDIADLNCLAVPEKYRKLVRVLRYMTIFIYF
jgi:lariat debranching enzyme